MLVKTIAVISTVDDTYDAYGTVEELSLYTDVIQSYKALLDLYEDYEKEMYSDGRSHVVYYAKERLKELVRSYNIEAKWFIEGHAPLGSEYLRNAFVTTTYYYPATTSYLVEKNRGQLSTGIECYMRDYSVSIKEAMAKFQEMDHSKNEVPVATKATTKVTMEKTQDEVDLWHQRDVSFKEDVFPFKLFKYQTQSPHHIFPLEDQYLVQGSDETYLQIPVTMSRQGDQQLQAIPTYAQSVTQDQRKSTRGRKPPGWMNDFVFKSTKKVPHAIANHVSYDKLSSSFKDYVLKSFVSLNLQVTMGPIEILARLKQCVMPI
ncbi:5-epiaristolochene synthase [Capsicum annuum]|nr:5-epiaristolochene synthase [Capsicum annuum]